MCGIVGIISSTILTRADEEIFEDALIMDTVRGKDSVGVMVHDSFDVSIAKSIAPAHEFISSRAYTKACGTTVTGIIGHNRAATMGSVKARNAHPFEHGDVTLVHNGTLRAGNLNQNMFEVDSESIAYNLSQVDPDDACQVLSEINGAFALVWFDKRINSFRVARNDERDLWYFRTANDKTYFISSEPHIMAAACNRNNFNVDVKSHATQFKVGVLYTFDMEGVVLTPSEETFTVKKYIPAPVTKWTGTSNSTTNNSTGYSHPQLTGLQREELSKIKYKIEFTCAGGVLKVNPDTETRLMVDYDYMERTYKLEDGNYYAYLSAYDFIGESLAIRPSALRFKSATFDVAAPRKPVGDIKKGKTTVDQVDCDICGMFVGAKDITVRDGYAICKSCKSELAY